MIELKTAGEIESMRAAGRVVAAVHAEMRAQAAVGVSLRELDEAARKVLDDAGAGSSFLGYHPHFAPTPYPGVICSSVNDVMLHGLPTDYRLRDGDLLSVDFGAHIDGWHADAAISFVVGTPRQEDLDLIATAERCLAAGIEARSPVAGWATSGTRCQSSGVGPATASRTTSPDTASDGRCTRIPSYTTKRDPAGACPFGPDSSSRSSRV